MGEEAAGLIDDEEAPVADEAEGVEVGGEDGNAGERFNGVKEDAGESHGDESERGRVPTQWSDAAERAQKNAAGREAGLRGEWKRRAISERGQIWR